MAHFLQIPTEVLLNYMHYTVVSLALSASRPFAVMIIFIAFTWSNLTSGIIKGGLAIGVSLPLTFMVFDKVPSLPIANSFMIFAYVGKEMLIGFLLGIIASFPFWGIQAAGAVLDSYRGMGSPDQSDYAGGQLTVYGTVFTVISLIIFTSLNGFWHLFGAIYQSYALWPILDLLPVFSIENTTVAAHLFGQLIKIAIILAAPFLILMVAVDFVLLIAARGGKQFQAFELSWSLKNLLALVMMPLVIYILADAIAEELPTSETLIYVLELIL